MAIQFGVKEILTEVGKYGFGIVTGTGITLLGLLAWTGADDLDTIKSSVSTYVETAEADVDDMALEYQVLVGDANASIEQYQNALADANANISKLVGAYTNTKTTLESTQSTLESTQATLNETKATLESTQNDLATKEQEFADLQTQLKENYVSVDEVNEVIEKANAEIDEANRQVANTKDEVVNKTNGSNLKQIYEIGVAGAELIGITEDDLAVEKLPEDLQATEQE